MPQVLSLFDQPERKVLSVSALTEGLRTLVESRYESVWVEGELSNFKRHSSGHCYFTLKDHSAQIRGVMFRGNARFLRFRPKDGMLVQVFGAVSVYETRGDLQIVARSMKIAGEGALQVAFDRLKRKLAGEGLFERAHKKRLPSFPQSIGIVTSDSGAALHDILSIIRRRFPCVQILLRPVQVQGDGAAAAIRDAIRAFDRAAPKPDVLIVGRGGGSLEDLWAFNEEGVARAIYDCTIPVVSAVGHETDVSIADFVADVRAATPSMAAELVVPDRLELIAAIRKHEASITTCLRRTIERYRRHIRYLVSSHSFRRPVDQLRHRAQQVDELVERLQRTTLSCLDGQRRRVKSAHDRLRLLSPERPLAKGYVLIERDGDVVRRSAEIGRGDAVVLRFADGRRHATVNDNHPVDDRQDAASSEPA